MIAKGDIIVLNLNFLYSTSLLKLQAIKLFNKQLLHSFNQQRHIIIIHIIIIYIIIPLSFKIFSSRGLVESFQPALHTSHFFAPALQMSLKLCSFPNLSKWARYELSQSPIKVWLLSATIEKKNSKKNLFTLPGPGLPDGS